MGSPLRRTYDALLLALLATGFLTLAITGRLAWPVLALAGLGLLVRGAMLWRGIPVALSARTAAMALLAYVPLFALDGLFLSRSFVQASLDWVVLAGVAKTFGRRVGHDDLTLGVLAFLEVLTAALVTVSGVFFLLFLLFLALLVATLVAHEMLEAGQRAGAAADGASAAPEASPPSFLRFSLGLSAAVGLLSLGIFFVLPRTAFGAWGMRPSSTGLTGFSDTVQLGAIARLQRSDRPVMHIRLTGQPALSPDAFERIPWRGRGLTDFDGQRWTSAAAPVLFSTQSGHLTDNPPLPHTPDEPAQIVSYEVTLEPQLAASPSPVLFFPARLLSASTRFPVLALDRSSDTLAGLSNNLAGTAYTGISDVAQPSPAELRRSPGLRYGRFGFGRGSRQVARYLELPPGLDSRIPTLARRIVAGAAPDNYDRLEALTTYLQSHYQYTLDDLPQGADPLATFLFDQPGGDCEYFASALAVMARSLGIPTRLVNGFLIGAYNPITGEYLVRGRDAHTWVEAQFLIPIEAGGQHYLGRVWVPFDATPAAPPAAATAWPETGMFFDALSTVWQEWIVNYDWVRQARLSGHWQDRLDDGLQQAWAAGASTASDTWAGARAGAESLAQGPARSPWPWGGVAVLALGLVGAGWTRRRRGFASPQPSPAAQRAYRQFQSCLRSLGVSRRPADTSSELLALLLRRFPASDLVPAAAAFVAQYEAARFGPPGRASYQLAHHLREVRRQVRRLRR